MVQNMLHDGLVLSAVITQTAVKHRLLTNKPPPPPKKKKYYFPLKYVLTFLNCVGVTPCFEKIMRSTHFRLGITIDLATVFDAILTSRQTPNAREITLFVWESNVE